MNKILALLLGIIILEITLGYSVYQSNISKLTGNKISSILYFFETYKKEKKKDLIIKNDVNKKSANSNQGSVDNLLTEDINKKNTIFCNEHLSLNSEFNIFSTRYLRHSLKLQSTLKFMNTIDFKDKFVIAIAGNSEAYGLTHSDKNNLTLHRILEKKLNHIFNTNKIFVINISDIGYFINDQLMALKQLNDIYPIDMGLFLSGFNELYKLDVARELLEKNYIFNKKNDLWYVPHAHSSFSKFNNTYQECMNKNLFVTNYNIIENDNIFESDKYIFNKYDSIKKELSKIDLDYLFFIQPFNEERLLYENTDDISSRDRMISNNWQKLKNIKIKDDKFYILKKPNRTMKFTDYAHTKNISETADLILDKIIKIYKNEIENKI